jgi:hypothetical protein
MDKTDGRIEQMREIQNEALRLFSKKNRDYGDAFAEFGPVGVIVRMGDKIKRLVSINNSGVTLVDNESIRDTLIDLHNYAAMAIMTMEDSAEKENETFEDLSLQFNSNGEGI